jgi:hypothetical protein
MRSGYTKGLVGIVAAASFMLSSTAATAAQMGMSQPDPLAVLSAMSGGPAAAAALCGAAAATAAQPAGGCVLPQLGVAPPVVQAPPQPVPVPPVEPAVAAGLGISPLLLGLAAIAAGVGAYLIIHHSSGNNNKPVSPA